MGRKVLLSLSLSPHPLRPITFSSHAETADGRQKKEEETFLPAFFRVGSFQKMALGGGGGGGRSNVPISKADTPHMRLGRRGGMKLQKLRLIKCKDGPHMRRLVISKPSFWCRHSPNNILHFFPFLSPRESSSTVSVLLLLPPEREKSAV